MVKAQHNANSLWASKTEHDSFEMVINVGIFAPNSVCQDYDDRSKEKWDELSLVDGTKSTQIEENVWF